MFYGISQSAIKLNDETSAMIIGVGCDIVDLKRLRRALEKYPVRLPARLLTAAEQALFARRADALPFLGGRIAAKESLHKAVAASVGRCFSWREVSVLNDDDGKPIFVFSPSLEKSLRAGIGGKRFGGKRDSRNQENDPPGSGGGIVHHLSISHHGDYAMAVVVAESAP